MAITMISFNSCDFGFGRFHVTVGDANKTSVDLTHSSGTKAIT